MDGQGAESAGGADGSSRPLHDGSRERARERLARSIFFIVGTGRCGSTMLAAMLGSHSRMVVPPETNFFLHLDPETAGGGAHRSEETLAAHLDRVRGGAAWPEVVLDEAALRESVAPRADTSRTMLLEILRQWSERSGKPRAGEKSPSHEEHLDRIVSLFPDAKIIHIYRDPRDVAASFKRIGRVIAPRHRSPMISGRSSAETYERIASMRERLGERRLTDVRYETLVEEPERELARLCAFLGEEYEAEMLEFHRRETPAYRSEAYWKKGTNQPLSRGRVGKYRETLSGRQIRNVEREVGEWLERLGYEASEEPDRLLWSLQNGAERAYRGARGALHPLGRAARRARRRVKRSFGR